MYAHNPADSNWFYRRATRRLDRSRWGDLLYDLAQIVRCPKRLKRKPNYYDNRNDDSADPSVAFVSNNSSECPNYGAFRERSATLFVAAAWNLTN